ncbi:MAG: hypothetical protein Wins2KO_24450 [Winogradskyella sp.]
MNKQFFVLLTLLTLISQNLISQNFKFGKVSKEEIEEKYHPLDSSTNAAILYKSENVTFNYTQSEGFSQVKEVSVRIKIYNKEGLNWATEKVYLYKSKSGNDEKIKGIKGYTYNLVKGKINKSKLKSDGIFTEQSSEIFDLTSFTLPNANEGSVIEYQYMVKSPFLQIDDINLQYTIPLNKIDVSVATPQFYKYNRRFNSKAFFTPNISESKKNRKASITQRGESSVSLLNTGGGQVGSGSSIVNREFEYNDNVISISEVNIPSLKAESFGGNLNNYRAKISLELEARLAREGYVEKSFASTWEGVSKTIYESEKFGGQLRKSSFYKEELESHLNGVEDVFQKVFLTEAFVKSRVKWNGNYGKYSENGIRTAYQDGAGNVADINLLLVSMLKSQGINASPVLISTRNNGVPLFPTRKGFNYVICLVEHDGKILLMDATEPYSINNVLPERVINWQGRVITEDGQSRWIDVSPDIKSKKTTMLNVQIQDDFVVKGKVRESYTSNLALDYRKRYTNLSSEDHIKLIENNKGNIEVSELNFENAKDLIKPVKVTYNYILEDGVDEIADKLYFSPLLFLTKRENPFKLEDRIYPIDFRTTTQNSTIVNILLPEGYSVESLPESSAMDFGEGNVKFSYIMKENGKYLSLKVNFEINNPIIAAEDYKNFKAFYSKVLEKNAEQIVLVKAQP